MHLRKHNLKCHFPQKIKLERATHLCASSLAWLAFSVVYVPSSMTMTSEACSLLLALSSTPCSSLSSFCCCSNDGCCPEDEEEEEADVEEGKSCALNVSTSLNTSATCPVLPASWTR